MTEKKAPIEEYFPVTECSYLASKEGAGGVSKIYYRPIYFVHKWWARRLGTVFRTLIMYSLADEGLEIEENPEKLDFRTWSGEAEDLWDLFPEDIDLGDKTVLDPFMGGGTTIVEGRKLGCNVIGQDLNQVAWFTTKKAIEDVDRERLREKGEKVLAETREKISKYYTTSCKHCGESADSIYYFWIHEVDCRNCGDDVSLFKSYMFASRKGKRDGHWVICPDCEELFVSKDYKENNSCPSCSNKFNPNKEGNYYRGKYTCSSCGFKEKVSETIGDEKPRKRLYAVEFYCDNCEGSKNDLVNGSGYKKADKEDTTLYNDLKDEYRDKKDKLPIPHVKRIKGGADRVVNYNFKYSDDLYNERQLLGLGTLLKEIEEVEDQNVREFLLATFSKSLEYSNMLCEYQRSRNKIYNLFRKHAFQFTPNPVENNFLAKEKGFGTFPNSLEKLVEEVKEYNENPREIFYRDGEKITHTNRPINAKLADDYSELEEDKNCLLMCGDSSNLDIPDKSVDAVITDPPYFDNVMYSELSEFYYVWLREILKEDYEHFNSEHPSRSSEVIKDYRRDKTEEDFTDGLTRVFKESRRKLKDDGIMAFTFHHKDSEAWASVLGSVLKSGFYVSAIYPIEAEMSTSLHIHKKGSIDYDMIIVCRKRDEEPEKGIWQEMEDKIYLEAKEEISRLENSEKKLSEGDLYVITVGKCLELYSKHYPNVEQNGEEVSVSEALDYIQEIVDGQLMGGLFDELIEETDVYTATYLTYVAGKGGKIAYSSLNKNLQQRNVSISDLVSSDLIRKEDGNVIVPDIDYRAKRIQNKSSDDLTALDRAHYLIYLKNEDILASEMREWYTDETLTVLRHLGDLENKEEYLELAEFLEEKMKDTSLK